MHANYPCARIRIRIYLARSVYGLAAAIFGVITLAWRDRNAWRQIMPLGKVTHSAIFLYAAAAIELLGGFAIQWAPTRRIGAFLSCQHLFHLRFVFRSADRRETSDVRQLGRFCLSNSPWSRGRWLSMG